LCATSTSNSAKYARAAIKPSEPKTTRLETPDFSQDGQHDQR
jgi:hypothetical protein